MTRAHLTALLLLALVVVWLATTVQGHRLPFGLLFSSLSSVVAIMMLVLVAFEYWIWKWPILYPWFSFRPDIGGRWTGEIRSLWRREGEGALAPIPVEIVIHQTYSEIRMVMTTNESRSESLTGSVRLESHGSHTLAAVYLNVPRLEVRDRSPIHHGALVLRIEGRRPDKLKGDYWTDRDSKGEILLARAIGQRGQAER